MPEKVRRFGSDTSQGHCDKPFHLKRRFAHTICPFNMQPAVLLFYLFLSSFACAFLPSPTQCPCAWLERGGVWSDERVSPLKSGTYVAARCPCSRHTCSRHWNYGPRSLTFRWVGMHDSREYRFQMHFCEPVHHLRSCIYGEAAYQLRQVSFYFCSAPYAWLHALLMNSDGF